MKQEQHRAVHPTAADVAETVRAPQRVRRHDEAVQQALRAARTHPTAAALYDEVRLTPAGSLVVAQGIFADVHMRPRETHARKRAFARRLQANHDHQFHSLMIAAFVYDHHQNVAETPPML